MTMRNAALLASCTTLALGMTLTLGPTLARAADPTPAASAAEPAGAKAVTTASGLQYIDDEVGKGDPPKTGQTVSIVYSVFVGDTRIEKSPPTVPFEFVLGRQQALKALEEGVSTMRVGGKRKLMVPPALGYGPEGVPGKIPPNSPLVFEVELKAIK